MNEGIITAIAALLFTSLLVRILPVVYDFQFPAGLVKWMETILPSAVFLNFIVYIFLQEMQISIVATLVSLGITAILAYLNLGGLFVGVLGGCMSYYLLTIS
jgi:branched-subunit amino acid transport protein AzlD